jgi:hypothetical protein
VIATVLTYAWNFASRKLLLFSRRVRHPAPETVAEPDEAVAV